MDPLHEASFIGRASSIEEFCSEHMTVSSLSEINSDEKKKNLFEGENQNDNDEHEMYVIVFFLLSELYCDSYLWFEFVSCFSIH